MLRKSFVFAAIGMIIFSFASLASADVPHMINYQGKLTDAGGGLVNDTVQMTFSIYPDTLGSPAEWSETQMQVIVENGIFNVLLGAVDTIPSVVFDGNVKYLGVQVESDPEMTPLKPMVSVPYAYRAGSADGAGGGGGWVDDGTVVRLETDTDQVGIGTASPEANLDVNDRIRVAGDWARIELLSSPNTVAGKISQDGNGHIKVAAPAGAGNVVLETQGTGRVNVKQNGTVYTHAASNVGIGTEWPEAHLHVDQPGIESDPIGVKVGPRWASGNPYNTGTQRVQIQAWSGSAGLSLAEHAVGGFLIGTDGPDLTIKEGHDGSGGERVRVTETGKVGIGISAPKAKLDVNGGIKGAPKTDSPSVSNALPLPDSVAYGFNASYSTDGGGMFAWYQGETDHTDLAIWYGDDQNADLRFLRGQWDGTYQDLTDVMTLAANGNVGIGTKSPSPQTKVHVANVEEIGIYVEDAPSVGIYSEGWNCGIYGHGVRHGGLFFSDTTGVSYAALRVWNRYGNTSNEMIARFCAGIGEQLRFYFRGDGYAYADGNWGTFKKNRKGEFESFSSIQAERQEIISHGTGRLVGGTAQINFSSSFSEFITDAEDIEITATPLGSYSGLYIAGRTKQGFTVKSGAGDPNCEFTWIAIGVEMGEEERPTIGDIEEQERMARLMKEEITKGHGKEER